MNTLMNNNTTNNSVLELFIRFSFIFLTFLLYILAAACFGQDYMGLMQDSLFNQVRLVFFVLITLAPLLFIPVVPVINGATLGSLGCILFIALAVGADLSLLIPIMFPMLYAVSLQLSYLQTLFWIIFTNTSILLALNTHNAWGTPVMEGTIYNKLMFAMISVIVTFLFLLLKRQYLYIKNLTASIERLDQAYQKVVDANLDFQTYALFAREEAMEKERRRLAGELHDIIGYSLTNVIMLIQAAQIGKGDSEQTHAILEKARLHADESLKEVRYALATLRAEPADRPRGANLFLKLTQTFQEVTGVTISVDFANIPSLLPVKTEKIIYRLIQEGLTNAFRHGKASEISISFWYEQNSITLRIRDNGNGGSSLINQNTDHIVERSGIGLAGLQEQVEQLGGNFTAGAVSGGFILEATIPVQETEEGNK
ncbi:sensor histidine kinase [Gracilinema caldarium]|uniref:sensor histidine kinase n=1 Tax=Gracilinema caldarium TaxID=215591 RepID=UPI0026F34845|nr:sensor histidine kinase [Gracilinema caldarium]